jgi:hypothetical protein
MPKAKQSSFRKALQDNYTIAISDFLVQLQARVDRPVSPDFCSMSAACLSNKPDYVACMHYYKRTGKSCQNVALDNGFCSKHQSESNGTMEAIVGKVSGGTRGKNKLKPPTKTQLQIEEWLNTAVSHTPTVLTLLPDGKYLDKITELVFTKKDDTFIVIGRFEPKSQGLEPLSHFDQELCESKGWRVQQT